MELERRRQGPDPGRYSLHKEEVIRKAAFTLIRGGVVIYPTETVYGIGARVFSKEAVERVFAIKKRPLSMPLSVAVSSFTMANEVAELSDSDLELLEALLPGPVTFLVKRSPKLPDMVTAGSPLVGIRYPDHAQTLKLIELSGPITSTSANLTGLPPPRSLDEVDPRLANEVDLILDGGKSRFGKPSTLVDLESRKVIREGARIDRVRELIG